MIELEQEFNRFIKQQLTITCEQMYDIALQKCKGSYIDSDSCVWYHSAWQYLRILDKVSSPTWHFDFYYNSFDSYLTKDCKVLISGTADYTLLAILYFVAKRKNITINVFVCDICETPLLMCKQFAKSNNFEISIFQNDILSLNCLFQFDIITTDAFLSRFPFISKQKIISKWSTLLSHSGKIITTIRVNDRCIRDQVIKSAEKKDIYLKDIEALLSENYNEKDKLLKLASDYISSIISIPFCSQSEIIDVMTEHNLSVLHLESTIVKGEVEPCEYYRTILQK